MSRHSDAVAIQQGACNPSGIALSIVDACKEIRGEPGHTGTAQITGDAAIRLMVHQLAHICRANDEQIAGTEYGALLRECETKARKPQSTAHCAECGEVWPCSDSGRRDIMPTLSAKHRQTGGALVIMLEAVTLLALLIVIAGCAVTDPSRYLERDKVTGEYSIQHSPFPKCSAVTLSSNPRRTGAPYSSVCEVR